MTTIITRVFPDVAAAEAAVNRLNLKGFPRRDRQIIVAGDKAEAAMKRAQVHETAIAPYTKRLAAGNVVLVVKATYKPLGAARITREVLAKSDTIDTGAVIDDFSVPWTPERAPSVLKDHPLFLSLPDMEQPGRISTAFGMPLLKERKTKRSLMSHDRRMSRMFWPMPLLSKRKRSSSVISGGRYMSRMFWPMKLLSTGTRSKSVIPGGGTPLSRRLGLKTIS